MRHIALASTLAAVAVAGPAGATTIKLSMSTTVDPAIQKLGGLEDGTLVYGWRFPAPLVQVLDAEVTDDAGALVENACLAGGARIELVDATLAVRGGASCTNVAGKWQFVLTGNRLIRPNELTAQLLTPATTIDGRALSPAASNRVAVLFAPKLTDTTRDTHRGSTYPVSGYITMPVKLRALGTIKLQKKSGSKWVTMFSKKTDSAGKFKFSITQGAKGTTSSFRFWFQPPKDVGWIPVSSKFTITWS